MKTRRFILQCASFALLLVFSQKAGAGLFLHNLLHGQDNSRPFEAGDADKGGREISFSCNCIDDFLVPFATAEDITVPEPVIACSAPGAEFVAEISFRPVIIAKLRGPPVLVS